jgi:hypothetical protein
MPKLKLTYFWQKKTERARKVVDTAEHSFVTNLALR